MAVKLMPVAQVAMEVAPAEPVEVEEQQQVRQPRKRRKAAVYDADGNEVLITLKCLKCLRMHPLSNFGLRKMADGAIRNQPWCRECRGASSPKKKPEQPAAVEPVALVEQPTPAPVYSGPMHVESLTAEQVLRALAPQPPQAVPALTEAPQPSLPELPQVAEPKPE